MEYEKLVFCSFIVFARNMKFLSVAHFAFRKVLATLINALLTISHHVPKSLDGGMLSYIVQLDSSATFDRVSHSGLFFKLKWINEGGNILICRKFLSNRRQNVLPLSGSQSLHVCHGEVCWVHFCSLYIPAKCLSWWRTDFMLMEMTLNYW